MIVANDKPFNFNFSINNSVRLIKRAEIKIYTSFVAVFLNQDIARPIEYKDAFKVLRFYPFLKFRDGLIFVWRRVA